MSEQPWTIKRGKDGEPVGLEWEGRAIENTEGARFLDASLALVRLAAQEERERIRAEFEAEMERLWKHWRTSGNSPDDQAVARFCHNYLVNEFGDHWRVSGEHWRVSGEPGEYTRREFELDRFATAGPLRSGDPGKGE